MAYLADPVHSEKYFKVFFHSLLRKEQVIRTVGLLMLLGMGNVFFRLKYMLVGCRALYFTKNSLGVRKKRCQICQILRIVKIELSRKKMGQGYSDTWSGRIQEIISICNEMSLYIQTTLSKTNMNEETDNLFFGETKNKVTQFYL